MGTSADGGTGTICVGSCVGGVVIGGVVVGGVVVGGVVVVAAGPQAAINRDSTIKLLTTSHTIFLVIIITPPL
ncbi:MAG: hypothetical protein A2Z28_01260 [Chloroflexi bacterium RBG_16_51_9]|nr:MAG: hypothetical protein A2Z28_01260 [Chloroflexi bacterium RBG_16_51_9]